MAGSTTVTSMETITINLVNGTTLTFTGCTGYSRDATSVTFKGKLSGQDVSKTWEFNWSQISYLNRETQ